MNMKILHVLHKSLPYVQKGYTVRTDYVLREQRRLGYEPIAATKPDFPGERIARAKGLKTREYVNGILHYRNNKEDIDYRMVRKIAVTIGSERLYRYNEKRLFPNYLMRIAKKHNVNLIQATSPASNVWPALRVAKSLRIPVIYEVRGLWEDTAVALGQLDINSTQYEAKRQAETKAMTEVDAVVTISETLKEEFVKRGVDQNRIFVVPNGVNTNRFKPVPRDDEIARRHGLGDAVVIGYIGSIRRLEGFEYLLQALPLILQNKENVKVLFVGSGEDRQRLELLSRKMDLENHVVFSGEIPHKDILKYYSVIDIVVIPRVNNVVCNLVPPLKPLEAMAMEKAVVVSDVAALKEIVIDGLTGVHFVSENARDLAEKCRELIGNRGLRAALGRQARKWICEHRSWERVARNYAAVYNGGIRTS